MKLAKMKNPARALAPATALAAVLCGGEIETTLADMTSANTPTKGLVVPGYVFNIVRIR